ncbi:MAG TPA: FecR domain-containing protein [Ramlibacter sp.]|nr:FecR domain-containing protein [Ramlibacter sp.]
MSRQKRTSLAARIALAAGLLLAAGAAGAQQAGEVEFSRGVGFAQSPGAAPRTMGRGLELKEGDRLTTSDGGSAIIKLQDGTRMTVRPNTEMVISQFHFKENAPDNSMLMQLVRGGFRAVTGLINKSSPNAARIQTNTATIGIRGTDFDARICQGECGRESQQVSAQARPNTVLASAKIAQVSGQVFAVDTSGQRRRLSDGGSVYPGDVVETLPGGRAVLAFRDESRVTVGSNSRFRVDNFVYDDKNATEGRFLASILRGSVRALTGLIAKADNKNVGFSTATATIGIRGTGFDAECADEECKDVTLWAWLGSIAVTPQGTSALQVLSAGQGLFISPQGIRPVPSAPAMDGPRPDSVTIPPKLFSKADVSDATEGLFVFVRDGHIEIATASQVLQLGKGEAGFAGTNGDTERPTVIPKFIEFDKMPLPSSKNPLLVNVLADAGIKQQNQCK